MATKRIARIVEFGRLATGRIDSAYPHSTCDLHAESVAVGQTFSRV